MRTEYNNQDTNNYRYESELDFLTWQGKQTAFPYFWTQKYNNLEVEVGIDENLNMMYVIHDGKRLYLPLAAAKSNIGDAKYNYRNLRMEADCNSPHRYTTNSLKLNSEIYCLMLVRQRLYLH